MTTATPASDPAAHRYPPPAELAANANVTADDLATAVADPEAFWAQQKKVLTWDVEPTETLDWSNPPFAKWYADGTLNAAYNCVDRHVENGHGDRVAIYFEGEPGDSREITYAQLQDEVCRAANGLAALGVQTGDRVAIYLPMIPEAVISMLACARLGAIHTVIFGGFSADALSTRINDCGVEVVITADGGYRRGAPSALKPAVDRALEHTPGVRQVVVVKRTGQETSMTEGRDVWWDTAIGTQSPDHTPEMFPAEHPLFVMYTSGSTGRPKGILHTTGGYLVGTTCTTWATFDLKPETDIYWCTADIGWITGHSYMTYGPLANGVSQVMYEGTPDSPHKGRWWEIIDKYKVTIFYTAPTAIRTFMKWGDEVPAKFDMSSLRLMGSVGEPINPEAYNWYHQHIGRDRCPIVDTWWQTETGMIMIAPMPGVATAKPGSAMQPLPGVSVDVVDDEGHPLTHGESGLLVVTKPWPAMLRTLWGEDQRYIDTYWARFGDRYFAGDGARIDEDGDIWLLGRVDDVMNISGHRLSTAEIESSLVGHEAVAEAAVVGASDPTTGHAIVAFVILISGFEAGEAMATELRNHVGSDIGPIAKPRQVMIVDELPKTRSGKIMRRLLRDIAENREVGDVTTLTDSTVMDTIKKGLAT